jgi:hypothetical protein
MIAQPTFQPSFRKTSKSTIRVTATANKYVAKYKATVALPARQSAFRSLPQNLQPARPLFAHTRF